MKESNPNPEPEKSFMRIVRTPDGYEITEDERVAIKYAKKICWNENRKPDAYAQEDQRRVENLILEAFAERYPLKLPVRIL